MRSSDKEPEQDQKKKKQLIPIWRFAFEQGPLFSVNIIIKYYTIFAVPVQEEIMQLVLT